MYIHDSRITNLNISYVTLGSKIHPVGLIKFRPNHIVEIRDLIVFSDECRCKAGTQSPCKVDPEKSVSPVSPSFECALIVVTTRRNIAAGTT